MEKVASSGISAAGMPSSAMESDLRSVEGDWCQNPHLSRDVVTPIEGRLPALSDGFSRLRALLGDECYEKYISTLQNVTRRGGELLIVSGSFMQRSIIERDFIPQLKEAFEVSHVRIVA